jgi:choline dehydrogenase-like flavoprotein
MSRSGNRQRACCSGARVSYAPTGPLPLDKIMPTTTRGNTNIPVTMLAERAAELIADRNRPQASEPRAASRR